MEVAMDERVSGEEGLRLVQRLEPLHGVLNLGIKTQIRHRADVRTVLELRWRRSRDSPDW